MKLTMHQQRPCALISLALAFVGFLLPSLLYASAPFQDKNVNVKTRGRELSPPIWVFYGKLHGALEGDEAVLVQKPKEIGVGAYELSIELTSEEWASDYKPILAKAQALADLVSDRYTFSNSSLVLSVYLDGLEVAPQALPQSLEGGQALLLAALADNKYFYKLETATPLVDTSLIFKPDIIQFFADDLSDFYGRMNLLVADVMAEVLRLGRFTHYRVGTGTAEKR